MPTYKHSYKPIYWKKPYELYTSSSSMDYNIQVIQQNRQEYTVLLMISPKWIMGRPGPLWGQMSTEASNLTVCPDSGLDLPTML